MQKRVLTTIVLALVSLGILTAQSKNPAQFFHRVGNEIINPNGEHFQIKGANVSCWLYQENYVLGGAQTAQKVTAEKISDLIGKKVYLEYIKKMMDSFLLEEDIKLMKRMGVNCVRLGFDAVLFESDSTKNWFFKSIDSSSFIESLEVFSDLGVSSTEILTLIHSRTRAVHCSSGI